MTSDEEIAQHTANTEEQCNLYAMNYKIKSTNKRRLHWISRRVRDEYGMVIYKDENKGRKVVVNTMPDGDMILTGDIRKLIDGRMNE